MQYTFLDALRKLEDKDYDEIRELVFIWVKEGKINSAVMESIIIHFWKRYTDDLFSKLSK